MSRVKRKERRRLALKKARTYEAHGIIELGLQGYGPRRPAKMALAADSRRP